MTMAMNSTSEGSSPIMFFSMTDVRCGTQVLRSPVRIGPSEDQGGGGPGEGEHRDGGEGPNRPAPAGERDGKLGETDQGHLDGVSGVAVAAPGAVAAVRGVDIAGDVGAGPKGSAAAAVNQVAEVDEEEAGEGEGDRERGKPKNNFTPRRKVRKVLPWRLCVPA